MTIIDSNRDALLIAIPMVGLLFFGFFRLDELFGKSKRTVKERRVMGGSDLDGRPICLDPDGQVFGPKSGKS